MVPSSPRLDGLPVVFANAMLPLTLHLFVIFLVQLALGVVD